MCTQQGIEDAVSPLTRCVVIARTIVDLKNYVDDPKAEDFADITINEKTDLLELDEATLKKLSQLKTRIKGILSTGSNGTTSPRNCLEHDVLWRYDDVIHPKLHAPYLNKLCSELKDSLTSLIDETLAHAQFGVEPDIYEEVLQHWLYCKRKAAHFFGQADTVASVTRYLAAQSRKPLIVYGDSGAGKTTLLAKMATDVSFNLKYYQFAIRFRIRKKVN